MRRSVTERIDEKCSRAISDIQLRIKEGAGINITKTEASEILGEKYWKGHLAVIPFDEVKKRYKRNGRRMVGCL